MRALSACAILAVPIFALSIGASEPTRSDARNDDLLGPIRTVSVRVERAVSDWAPSDLPQDPPILVEYFGCTECEYDRDGNRVKEGSITDGEFVGSAVRLRKDANGRTVEKIYEDTRGQIYRREEFGPFGITEQDGYDETGGEIVSKSFWFYDGTGHPSGFRGYDRHGVLISRSSTVTDPSGNFKEQWDYDQTGALSLHIVEAKNPESGVWSCRHFQGDGSLKVAVTTKGSKVVSYWQQSGAKYPYGSRFTVDSVGKTSDFYRCHEDGTCDHVISYFPDESRHNVSRDEWRDGTGTLIVSYDYEYELDAMGNWTKRIVRVWTANLAKPRWYETDYRTLTYWQR